MNCVFQCHDQQVCIKMLFQASIRPAGEEYCWMRSMLIPEHKAKGQSNSQWGPEVFPLSLFVVKMGK